MNKEKEARLEAAGWRVGTVREFLALSDEESQYIEMKLALANALRSRRRKQGMSQAELAKKIGSSQSRVARMEAADPSVSVDLLIHSLLSMGATRQIVARAIAGPGRRTAPAA